MLELDRLANHSGDLGALAADTANLPTANFCGRLRGDFLSATAVICGNRFGRGMVRPGSAMFDLDAERISQPYDRLKPALRDVWGAVKLARETLSVQALCEDVGTVSQQMAADFELVVGIAAHAAAVDIDVRRDFPSGLYRFVQIPVSTGNTGDVSARAAMRRLEVQQSEDFGLHWLWHLSGRHEGTAAN